MIVRETGRCSRGFFESLKTYAASSEEPDLSGLGVDSASNSVFRILGASPKFKIIEFYGYVRVITHYSPIALFVVLSTSLEGPNNGKKSGQIYPEHPSTHGMGVEADEWPSLGFDKQPHRR